MLSIWRLIDPVRIGDVLADDATLLAIEIGDACEWQREIGLKNRQRSFVELVVVRDVELARADGEKFVISSSPLKIRPALGLSWPETRLNQVVLPAPFGPTMTVSSPGWNAQVTSFTAACPPKRIVRFSVRREGVIEVERLSAGSRGQ